MKIIYLGMLLIIMSLSSLVQASSFMGKALTFHGELSVSSYLTTITLIRKEAFVDAPDISADEDLPFDNSTWSGYIMNWIMKLFLWFIYLSLILMILGGTFWFLTTRGFWSWLLCMVGAFFYAMLLGRYWGYTACLIVFVILFASIKLFLTSGWGKKKIDQFNASGLRKRRRK